MSVFRVEKNKGYTVITQRINAGHLLNQSSMAYQMAYMAREDYENYGVKKEWGLYRNKNYNTLYNKNDNSTINNIDQLIFPLEGNPAPILHVFNPENKEWQNFMLDQYKDAIDTSGFDGIHIDQMGSYWGNIDYYDFYGNYIDLSKTFSAYVDAIKAGLEADYPDGVYVTMNMVNGGTPSKDSFSSEYITKYADTQYKEEAKDFLKYLFSAENQKKYAETLGSPSAFTDVDANWAPAAVVEGVNSAIESAANIGFTNEKPAGFSGDDAGRMVQDLLAGKYTAEEFAVAYENAWDAGFNS